MSIALNGNGLITGAAFGDVPTFHAYPAVAQTVTTNVFTKMVLGTVQIDNKGWWSAANNRYTPLQEGWYSVSTNAMAQGTVISLVALGLYKNGVEIKRMGHAASGLSNTQASGHTLVYMNGTTDYLEFWGYMTATGTCQWLAGPSSSFASIALHKAGA